MVVTEGRGSGSKREEVEFEGVEEDEEVEGADPRTRPWPLKAEEGEEKGLLTFLIMPFILSFTSSIRERKKLESFLESSHN